MTRTPARPVRRTLVLAAGAVLATTPTAVAQVDHPSVSNFTSTQHAGGTLVPDAPPNLHAIRTGGSGFVGGHWAQMLYCTPYGPGTSVVGYTVLLGRWHASLGDDVRLLHNTAGGTVDSLTRSDADLPMRSAMSMSAGVGTATPIVPSPCIGIQAVARTSRTGAFLWTVDLERVVIRDEIGPSVDALLVEVPWVTTDTAQVSWHQQDNGFARGVTWGEVVGAGAIHLGDQPNGRVGGWIPVGDLPDGRHTLRVHRSGDGWATSTASITFGLDRTDPPVPDLHVATEAWTNAAGVAVGADATDDAGSGWVRNEFQVDGGPWSDVGRGLTVSAPGVHTVRVRAVDRAGRVSGASRTGVVRIDRTAPAIPVLEVDASPAAGPRLRISAQDAGGSGLGDCPATVAAESATGASSPPVRLPSASLSPSAEVDIPMRGMPAGDYTVTVTVCDTAGNTTTRRVRTAWQPTRSGSPSTPEAPAGGGTPVPPPTPGVVLGVMTVQPPPASTRSGRLELVGAVRVAIRRNGVAVLRGRLLGDGRAVPRGTRIAVADPRGRVVGIVRSGPAGAVVIRFRATRAGLWTLRRIGAPGGRVTVSVRLMTTKSATRGRR